MRTLTPEKLEELERLLPAVGKALSIGFVSWDGDGWYASPDHLGEDGTNYEDAKAIFRDARTAVNSLPALLAIARREERLRLAIDEILGTVYSPDIDTYTDKSYSALHLKTIRIAQQARAALTPEEGPLPSSEWEPDDELAGLPVTPEEGQAPE